MDLVSMEIKLEELNVPKTVRRAIKKQCIELTKDFKETNSNMRSMRSTLEGGVKAKREMHKSVALEVFEKLKLEFGSDNVVFSNMVELDTTKSTKDRYFINISIKGKQFNTDIVVDILNGKINIDMVRFINNKTEYFTNLTVKELKDSLKTVKTE